ncbi:serine-arginine protein 55-like [Tachypleus tridentatus]|uniref:serine-arginine protein 55-like n=1 Tax=Tachypleus tridentatus TaxID=6853 RepID=UPI003FD4E77A
MDSVVIFVARFVCQKEACWILGEKLVLCDLPHNSDMGTRVYIGCLNCDCCERNLEKFFKGYGWIREVLIRNGFGFMVRASYTN